MRLRSSARMYRIQWTSELRSPRGECGPFNVHLLRPEEIPSKWDNFLYGFDQGPTEKHGVGEPRTGQSFIVSHNPTSSTTNWHTNNVRLSKLQCKQWISRLHKLDLTEAYTIIEKSYNQMRWIDWRMMHFGRRFITVDTHPVQFYYMTIND